MCTLLVFANPVTFLLVILFHMLVLGNQTKSVGRTYIKLQDVYTYVCIFKFTDSDLAQYGAVSERKRKQNVDAISGMWFNTYKP